MRILFLRRLFDDYLSLKNLISSFVICYLTVLYDDSGAPFLICQVPPNETLLIPIQMILFDIDKKEKPRKQCSLRGFD